MFSSFPASAAHEADQEARVSRKCGDDAPVRLSEVVSALSYALDLTEGQPIGHATKSCVLGMRLAEVIGLSETEKADLYYALLLKDTGCSSNAARVHQIFGGNDQAIKSDLKTTDWTRLLEGFAYVRRHAAIGQSLYERALRIVKVAAGGPKQARELVQIRCERGADIVKQLGFSTNTAQAIYYLDEHWNGCGHPHGLKGEEIPLLSRILSLCQTVEVFHRAEGKEVAFEVIKERRGRWFDPQLVSAFGVLKNDTALWDTLNAPDEVAARAMAMSLEPESANLCVEEARLTSICEGFAAIIDAKSPWTFQHSTGVTEVAVSIAREMRLSNSQITTIRQAALLHDIGKLSVPNSILDKPGQLTNEEFEIVKKHPHYTQRILEKIASFDYVAAIAGAHHERLDGSGYGMNLSGDQLSLETRIISVADVFDALSAERPYRAAMPLEKVFSIMDKEVPTALCPQSYEALKSVRGTQ